MNLPINNYCERLSEVFWAEPINALTNGAFLISSLMVWFLLKRSNLKGYFSVLPYQLGIVGVGSFLWHTVRSPITHILDGGLLYIFIATLLLFILKSLSGKWKVALLGILSLIAVQVAVFVFVPALRDSPARHIIALLSFGAITWWTFKRISKLPSSIIIALALYAVAIVAKGIDLSICSVFPIGTHFMWHLFGAIATYYSVVALVELDKEVRQEHLS